jgi:hypothetical protein
MSEGPLKYLTIRVRAHLADEWDHVMLAKTEDIDIPYDDHLVVILGKDSIIDRIDQSLLVTLRHPQEGFGITFRGTFETLSIWVFADTFKDCTYGRA